MKAIVVHAAKDLRIDSIEDKSPSPGQVKIKISAGGICGSDLHYYNHGGIGENIRLKEPMILGHEVSGRISALGEGVTSFSVGDLVAVSPSRPCYACRYCHQGQPNHCENMRFYGSAMPFPHIQGAFRQTLIANAEQCVSAQGLSEGEAAMAEPLSVCLHAVRRAGDMLGKRVLITGSGPIGVLCLLAARCAGAQQIVVTDLTDEALAYASDAGSEETINMSRHAERLTTYQSGKGHFDVLFECSGAAPALAAGIAALAPRGVIVQLGLGGDMNIPVQALTAKELELRGSFRFHEEFTTAVRLMQKKQIDVRPLISQTIPMEDAVKAFEIASDRTQSMKTQISFSET